MAESPPGTRRGRGQFIGALRGHARGVQGHWPRATPRRARHSSPDESGTGKELIARAISSTAREHRAPFMGGDEQRGHPRAVAGKRVSATRRHRLKGPPQAHRQSARRSAGHAVPRQSRRHMPLAVQGKLRARCSGAGFERVGGNERFRQRRVAAGGSPPRHRDLKTWFGGGKVPAGTVLSAESLAPLPSLRERGESCRAGAALRAALQPRAGAGDVKEVAPMPWRSLRGVLLQGNIRERLQSVLKQDLLKAHGATLLPALPAALAASDGSVRPPAGTTTNWRRSSDCAWYSVDDGEQYARRTATGPVLLLRHVLEGTGGQSTGDRPPVGIARETLSPPAARAGQST